MGSTISKREVASVYFDELKASLPSQEGKVVAITGTTSGTGLVLARTLAQLQAKTILLLNRPSERATRALAALQEAVPDADFRQIDCDLQSFASVRAAAAQVLAAVGKGGLDVLVCNAGVMAMPDQATGDGYDVQMQTNHLSHFLLTRELMPALEQAAAQRGEARVVQHSSGARKRPYRALEERYLGKNGGNLGGDQEGWFFGGGRWDRYQQTKLANCVFTFALHDRLQARGSKVKALVAHPGLSATNLQVTTSQHGGMAGFLMAGIMYMAQSEEDGTMGILRCAADPQAESGQFYGPAGLTGQAVLVPPEDICTDQASKDMLWKASEAAIGQSFDI